jgi:hypothetical protein
MAKELNNELPSQVRVQLSLKLPNVAAANKARVGIESVEAYLATPNIADVVTRWPTLPPDVREKILAAAPMFARIVAIARRFA